MRITKTACLFLLLTGCAAKPTQAEVEVLRKQVDELYAQGNYTEAIPIAKKALAMAQQINQPDSLELGHRQYQLAVNLSNAGFNNDAEPYFRGALKAFKKEGKPRREAALAYIGLGNLYARKKDFPKSELAFFSSIEEWKQLKMENGEGHLIAISCLGVMLVEKGDLDKADEILRLALQACQETPDRPVRQHIAIISNIGEVAYLREDWKLAARYYRQSIEMAEAELPKDKGLMEQLKKNLKNATDKIR